MDARTINLYVGQEFKNYRELCKALNEKEKGGKSKILQQQDWERFLKYQQRGHKFLIEEVYSEPKPKIDRRKNGNNNNNKYGESIQKMILYLLVKNKGIYSSVLGSYLKYFSMVNENFNFCNDKVPWLASHLGVEEYYIYEFYYLVRGNYRDIFETALTSLKNKGYLEWDKLPMVCVVPTEEDEKVIQNNNSSFANIIPVFKQEFRVATQEEIKVVKEKEKMLLDKMGCKNKQQLIFSGRMPTFRKQLSETLLKDANIYYLYYEYRIVQNKTKEVEEISSNEYKELCILLNDTLMDNILKNADKRHSNVIDVYIPAFGKRPFSSKKDGYRQREDYTDIYNRTAKLLIYKNARRISYEIISQKNDEKLVKQV